MNLAPAVVEKNIRIAVMANGRLPKLISTAPDDDFIIETDLTDEEWALIAKGMADYEKDPSSFTPLENIL